jgi:hypothetical protein
MTVTFQVLTLVILFFTRWRSSANRPEESRWPRTSCRRGRPDSSIAPSFNPVNLTLNWYGAQCWRFSQKIAFFLKCHLTNLHTKLFRFDAVKNRVFKQEQCRTKRLCKLSPKTTQYCVPKFWLGNRSTYLRAGFRMFQIIQVPKYTKTCFMGAYTVDFWTVFVNTLFLKNCVQGPKWQCLLLTKALGRQGLHTANRVKST